MDRLKKILVLLLICFKANLFAQQNIPANFNNSIIETCYLKVNSNVFVTGEKIFYKVALFLKDSNKKSSLSKLVYIEMFDENKKNIFKHKIFLKEGTGNGDFFIPSALPTGNYKLIAYSNLMITGGDPIPFEIDLKIINPYQLKATDFKSIQIQESFTAKGSDKIDYDKIISLSKNQFSKREKGTITIKQEKIDLSKGIYSLSIKKIDSLTLLFDNHNKDSFIKTNSKSIYSVPRAKIPDLRGEIISGRIISTNNSSLANKNVSISIYGDSNFLANTKTDKNGQFNFCIDKPFSSSSIILQITDLDKNNYKIQYEDEKNIVPENLVFDKFELSNTTKKSIERRSIATQIQNAYFDKTYDSIVNINSKHSFYEPFIKEYKLDDYTRFPSLKETITEVLSEVYFTHENNNYKVHLMSADINNTLKPETLVLVDGILVQDLNPLFEYDMDSFDKINVVRGIYNYGPKVYNGIVSFTTKNKNYNIDESNFLIKPEILRPSLEKKYYNPNYDIESEKLKRIPDYRNQLLWIPELNLDKNAPEIKFYTSDISGLFEVVLDGFTPDGKPISITETFEVK